MKVIIAVIALFSASVVFAGKTNGGDIDLRCAHSKNSCNKDIDVEISPEAHSRARGGDADADANATARANATGGNQAQGQEQSAQSSSGALASNEGNTLSTAYNTRNKSLALALPGASADHGSTAPCLESKRGWTILGVGMSGRTSISSACFASIEVEREFARCVNLADNYLRLDRADLALAQLERCGGLEADTTDPEYVTKDELRERDERIIQTLISK